MWLKSIDPKEIVLNDLIQAELEKQSWGFPEEGRSGGNLLPRVQRMCHNKLQTHLGSPLAPPLT